jgi:cation diffusion facilitator CzcD-associated flavoprotein CzcO
MRAAGVDEPTIHRVVRQTITHEFDKLTRRCIDEPDAIIAELHEAIRAYAGEDFPIEPHFVPRYRPWQQRLAFCPEGDLFQAVAAGKASAVTDTIETFTETGVRTASGEEIEADIVLVCTGFNLLMMGGIPFYVDGREVDWHETVNYRGMMFTGVPNLVWVMGYFRASWTLRVDMLGDFVCKLLRHMDARGAKRVDVALRDEDHNMPLDDWIEADNFNPGYLMRGIKKLPKRGDKPEWRHNQDYWAERVEIPQIDLDGSEFLYDGIRAVQRESEAA